MADDDPERPRSTEPDLEVEAARSTLDDVPRGGTIPMGELIAARPEGGAAAEGAATDEGDEGDAAEHDEPARDDERPEKKTGRPILYAALGLVLFTALAGPILFYFLVWRYKPTAPLHIPAGTNLALRIDAKELYLFEPFRKSVLGVLEDAEGVKSRAARLKKETGIDLRSDVREIVVASPDGRRFVVLLGGYFTQARMNRASVTEGLRTFLTEEGVEGLSLDGDVLKGPGGIEIAQAEDTTIIVASDDEMLKAAREPSDEWTKLGLTSSGAASFAIEEAAFAHAAKGLEDLGGASLLAHTERATGFLKLGARPELTLELVPKSIGSEDMAKETEAALADARLLTMLLPDVFGEKAALATAHVKPRTSSVMVTTEWPKEGLEAGMRWLGDGARAILERR